MNGIKWSLYLGKIAGIKIFIHWTFLFLIGWIVFSNIRAEQAGLAIFYSLVFVGSVFFCVVLHELGHALMAKKFNYKTKDITLLPIGGMARMDEIPENPKHEFLVAIAGPIVNVIIAALLFPVLYFSGIEQAFFSTQQVYSFDSYFMNLFTVNLFLAIFNLIPAFPMDGGRIFRALLSLKFDRVKATVIAARTGQIIAIAFFFMGLFANPFLSVIGIFIFLMAQTESEYVKSKSILHAYNVKDVVMRKYFTLTTHNTILDAVKLLLDVQATDFLILDEYKHVVGTLNRDRIIKALGTQGKDVPLINSMNTSFKFVTPDMPLDKAFMMLQSGDSAILPVMEGRQLLGVIDVDNIIEFIMIKSAAERSPINHNQTNVTILQKPAHAY